MLRYWSWFGCRADNRPQHAFQVFLIDSPQATNGAARSKPPSFSTFFEESQNDEIENSGSVCHVRFIHCCSCFFRGDTGSIFEQRKTLSAGDTAKRCSHLGGRWNGPAAATDTAALARGSVLVSVL